MKTIRLIPQTKTVSRTLAFTLTLLSTTVLPIFTNLPTAFAGTDTYPTSIANCRAVSGSPAGYFTCDLKGSTQDIYYDPWGEENRECTSYASWMLHSVNGFEIPFFANAVDWKTKATNLGYTVDMTPKVGSIYWQDATPTNSFGHVAYVEAVSSDSSHVTTEDYNVGLTGLYAEHVNIAANTANGYIHFRDTSGGGGGTTQYDDYAIYRASEGNWYVKLGPTGSNYLANANPFTHGGYTGDIPLVGDFNHDGTDDYVIYRAGIWYVKSGVDHSWLGAGSGGLAHGGHADDVPLVGDFDGDGYSDYVIYRASTGTWYVVSGATHTAGSFLVPNGVAHGGHSDDIPLIGDYNADGKADYVIYRSGVWYVKNGYQGTTFIGPGANGLAHGSAGDIPLTGDIDGNLFSDFIIYRPSNGEWITKSGPDGSAYISDVIHGGYAGDKPLIGDYNGDRKDDAVIYRSGLWFVKAGPSITDYIGPGPNGLLHGGHADDVPLVGNFGS